MFKIVVILDLVVKYVVKDVSEVNNKEGRNSVSLSLTQAFFKELNYRINFITYCKISSLAQLLMWLYVENLCELRDSRYKYIAKSLKI